MIPLYFQCRGLKYSCLYICLKIYTYIYIHIYTYYGHAKMYIVSFILVCKQEIVLNVKERTSRKSF